MQLVLARFWVAHGIAGILGPLDLRFRFAPDLQDICQLGNRTFLGDCLIPNMHYALQRRTSVEQGPQQGTLFCIRALQFIT